jgi:sterol desaturase/sphingolipid hydroxylase (fatty acid hydroxylase superfamily)
MNAIMLGALTVIITLAIFAIGLAIERIAPAAPMEVEGIRLNIIYGIFTGFLRPGVTTMVAGVSSFGIGVVGRGLITLPSQGWKLGFSVIVYLLVADFVEYLFHRAQHAVPFLWALHSFHHSDRGLNVTTTTRHHWIDIFTRSIVIYPLVFLVFAVPYEALLMTSFVAYYNYFLHCNLRVSFGRWWPVLNSPQYHRIHHSEHLDHQGRNFAALFPIFDLLFHTYHRPMADEYPTTGLTGQEGPNAAWEAIVWPIRHTTTRTVTDVSGHVIGSQFGTDNRDEPNGRTVELTYLQPDSAHPHGQAFR